MLDVQNLIDIFFPVFLQNNCLKIIFCLLFPHHRLKYTVNCACVIPKPLHFFKKLLQLQQPTCCLIIIYRQILVRIGQDCFNFFFNVYYLSYKENKVKIQQHLVLVAEQMIWGLISFQLLLAYHLIEPRWLLPCRH